MAARARIWLACLVFAALIFAFDLCLPLEMAAGAFYVLVILVTVWLTPRWGTLVVAALCSVLMIVGAVFSPSYTPSHAEPIFAVVNIGAALLAVWATAYAVLRLRGSQAKHAAMNHDLEDRAELRAADARQRADELSKANASLEREVAQRKRAELAARDSQAVYASLVEDLPIPVVRKDAQGRFIFANRAFCSWAQRDREEIVGKTDFDFAPAGLAKKYRRDDQSVIDTGELFLDVEKNEHGGKVNWVHVIKTPARDGTGKIAGTQAIFWDVTARREAEDKLRDSEALYHSLVDTLRVCLLRKDLSGRVTFVNKAYSDFFQINPEDVIGKTDFDLFPRELAQEYRDGDSQVIQTGEIYESVERLRMPDGRTRDADVSKSPVYDANENITGVQIIFRDVTDELRLKAELKKSEQRLQAILDNSSAVIYLKDTSGRYLLVNREFESLFGLEHGEIIGKLDEEFFSEGVVRPWRENDRRVMETSEIVETEETAPTAGGERTYISIKFPLHDEHGKVYAVAGISTDITDRKESEQQLQGYAARLEATNRELEEFAYIVSHDLQEPLRTLQFFSDSLQADLGDKLDEQSRGDLRFIADAAERMQQLVRDLLSLSRTGRAELKRDPVPLEDCVNDAVKAISNRVRETGATIDVEQLPTVPGDRTMLTQVFQNLVGNALKFVADDRTPHVKVSCQPGEDSCVVCIADNGIGIKPEYAKKIFAPFQRLHASSEYEGTGIGLAICRKVIQRHGGNIWVESQPGEGSRFYFELPVSS